MIAPSLPRNVARDAPLVAQNPREFLRAMSEEAAAETRFAFDGIPGKAITRAGVPGVNPYQISRAMNGGVVNPLIRLVGWFVVMKRLGMGRERALRLVEWLREVVDLVWPPEDAPALEEVMEKETELDAADDPPQMRASYGCALSLRDFLNVKRAQHAYDAVVIRTVRTHLARMEARAG